MEDNKKDYSEFFSGPSKDELDKEQKNDIHPETEIKQEKPSYYYSYGPYKTASDVEERSTTDFTGDSTKVSTSENYSNVEMTPLRPFQQVTHRLDQGQGIQSPVGASWTSVPEQRRRSPVKSFFAAFLASAVVIASLMVASDQMNWFSGSDKVMVSLESNTVNGAATNNEGGSLNKTAAVDIVRPNNIAQIVQNSSPAVVKIQTFVKGRSRAQRGVNPLFDDPFFRQFFGEQVPRATPVPKQNSAETPLQQVGMGSGFIFEKSGYILTNQHVIDGAEEIQVVVQGFEKPFTAKLLGNSYDLDLAVLKIEGDKDFAKLNMGKADDVNVGDWVVAIGNPYGFDHTVTVGVLSAKERPIDIPDQSGTRNYKHLLQTDASINPGNSGGPLLNLNGEVIGINTAVSAQAQGIGFAIPTNTIQTVLENLINNVTIPKEPAPYIGVRLGEIIDSYVKDLQLENTEGTIVQQIQMGTPAFKAGVKTYDVIVGLNGEKIKNSQALVDKVKLFKVGEKITLNIIRDGKKLDITVAIGDMNAVAENPQR